MEKLLVLVLALGIVNVVGVTKGLRAENLLNNPDFEEDENEDGIADGWEFDAGVSLVKEPYSGKNSVKIVSNKLGENPCFSQSGISLKPNTKYRLSYMVKAGGGSKESTGYQYFRVFTTWFGIKYNKNLNQQEGLVWQDTLNAWQKKTLEFTSPIEESLLTITAQIKGPGSIFFDDFTLEEITTEKDIDIGAKIRLQKPYFRNSIYSSNPIKAIEGLLNITKNEVKKIELNFGLKGDLPFFTKTIEVTQKEIPFFIPAEDLKIGDYSLKIKVFSSNNSLLGEEEQIIKKLAQSPIEVVVNEDNLLLINGKPFFPIGLWEVPGASTKVFDDLSKNGFNLFIGRPDKLLLDNADKYNLKVISVIGEQLIPSDVKEKEKWEKNQREKIIKYINHPALLGYFISDEPLWGGYPLEPLIATYQLYQQVDPYRPVFLNHAPRNEIKDLSVYNQACDITGVDIYPVPEGGGHSELEDKTISCVGKYTDIMRASVNDQKPVWMTLQGFAWAHLSNIEEKGIYPTLEESRFMAYDAIIHGATGIMYWGTNHIIESSFWKILFKVSSELRDISTVLVSKTVKPSPVKVDNNNIVFLHKVCEGKDYIIAANESKKTLKVSFNTGFKDEKLEVLFENRTLTLNNGIFKDSFAPNEVHLYTTSNVLPSPLIEPLKEESTESTEKGILELVELLERSSPYKGEANWIWYPENSSVAYSRCYLRRVFSLEKEAKSACLLIAADDSYVLYFNEKKISKQSSGWSRMDKYDLTPYLKKGKNILAVDAMDGGIPPCGLIFELNIKMDGDKELIIISDDSCLVAEEEFPDWYRINFNDAKWPKAEIVAPYGEGAWGEKVLILPNFSHSE